MRRFMMLVIAGMALAIMPATASAATPWNCSASALDVSLAGQAPVSPVTANVGPSECKTVNAGITGPLAPLPLPANVLSARTPLGGPAGQPAQQKAGATGEVASLSVGPLASLPIPLPSVPTQPLLQ